MQKAPFIVGHMVVWKSMNGKGLPLEYRIKTWGEGPFEVSAVWQDPSMVRLPGNGWTVTISGTKDGEGDNLPFSASYFALAA